MFTNHFLQVKYYNELKATTRHHLIGSTIYFNCQCDNNENR